MLERGAALATWRLAADPAGLPVGGEIAATQLPDHRLAYLTYEGCVSRGRGSVKIVEKGTYETIRADETHLALSLAGERCRGRFELSHRAGSAEQWTLRRLGDE